MPLLVPSHSRVTGSSLFTCRIFTLRENLWSALFTYRILLIFTWIEKTYDPPYLHGGSSLFSPGRGSWGWISAPCCTGTEYFGAGIQVLGELLGRFILTIHSLSNKKHKKWWISCHFSMFLPHSSEYAPQNSHIEIGGKSKFWGKLMGTFRAEYSFGN